MSFTRQAWFRFGYKLTALVLLSYTAAAGFALTLPRVTGLEQSSRSLFFHLPMWFAMYTMMLVSLGWSSAYLRGQRLAADRRAREAAIVAVWFGVLGLLTGILWSRVTWGQPLPDTYPAAWWVWDPKQTGALMALLIYAGYLVLRSSVDEVSERARVAAIFNIFAFATIPALTYIVPRALQGLPPGAEGDTLAFDRAYRQVLYPAFLGFILLAFWLMELRVRLSDVRTRLWERRSEPAPATSPLEVQRTAESPQQR